MIDRLLRMVLQLLVVLVLLGFGISLFLNLLRQGSHSAAAATQHVLPRLMADVFITLATGLFCIGLGVRLQRALTGRDGRAGRERVARQRQTRLTVRRPADDVPVEGGTEAPADPDPAIELGGD